MQNPPGDTNRIARSNGPIKDPCVASALNEHEVRLQQGRLNESLNHSSRLLTIRLTHARELYQKKALVSKNVILQCLKYDSSERK